MLAGNKLKNCTKSAKKRDVSLLLGMVRFENLDREIRKIKRQFSGLSKRAISASIARAINHTLGIAKTDINRQTRSVYNIALKDLNSAERIDKAFPRKSWGALESMKFPLPLSKFKPVEVKGNVQTKYTGSSKYGGLASRKIKRDVEGVSVEVYKGKRVNLRGAFFDLSSNNRHGAVKALGRYTQQGFAFNENDPKSLLRTKSVYYMILSDKVGGKQIQDIRRRYSDRLFHELKREFAKTKA